jgi:hypothetical protein
MKKKVPEEIRKKYKLPAVLTDFQLQLYVHLIEWKWKHLTTVPGKYGKHFYDAILPKEFQDKMYPLYRPLVQEIRENYSFKPHVHFGHMASSQAACINLFAPVLLNEKAANAVFPIINPHFSTLAIDTLTKGFDFEYWHESNPLNDHTDAAGTDSDIAIAYYDTDGKLCLWLIEHKLSEDEFTTCGGYRSKGNLAKSQCRKCFEILNDPRKCYYQYHCGYKYWDLTYSFEIFDREEMKTRASCPFIGGENQLWRNQLLAYAIETNQNFNRVHFSVVHHPRNNDLQKTISSYSRMLKEKSLFSVFTSKEIVEYSSYIAHSDIQKWVKWYADLYMID